jgi:hypothetical protein
LLLPENCKQDSCFSFGETFVVCLHKSFYTYYISLGRGAAMLLCFLRFGEERYDCLLAHIQPKSLPPARQSLKDGPRRCLLVICFATSNVKQPMIWCAGLGNYASSSSYSSNSNNCCGVSTLLVGVGLVCRMHSWCSSFCGSYFCSCFHQGLSIIA